MIMEFLRDFLEFMRSRKKYWLAPIVIFLIIIGFLFVFASSSAAGSLVYTLF